MSQDFQPLVFSSKYLPPYLAYYEGGKAKLGEGEGAKLGEGEGAKLTGL